MFRDWMSAGVAVIVLGCGGSEDALSVADGSEEPAPTEDPNATEVPSPEDPPPGSTDPVPSDTTRPARLSEHTASYLETAQGMLVFGGTDGVPSNCGLSSTSLRDEAWFFHEDDSAPGGSWELLEGTTPSARLRHMAASSADKAWIFGGRFRVNPNVGAFTLYDDLWEFDAETMEFSEVEIVGESPPARASGSLCYDAAREQLWLFGGNTSPDAVTYTALGDLWRFDLAARTWEEVEIQSDTQPAARLFHSGVCDAARDQLVIFAGGDERIFSAMSFGDLWALDLTTLEWRALDEASTARPVPRFWQTLEWDRVRNTYLLFGGHDDTDLGNRNDLWEFDPESGQWTERFDGDVLQGQANGVCDFPPDFVDPDLELPERRDSHTSVWSPVSEGLLIFAGKTDCGSADDLWRYTTGGDWQPLYDALSGESCVRIQDGDISQCAGACIK